MSNHAAKKATQWLTTIYFSELGFLGLPYFMISVPEGPIKFPRFSFEGWFNRIRRRWSQSSDSPTPLPSAVRIYWSYSIVFFIRGILNTVGFALILSETPNISSEVPYNPRLYDPDRKSMSPTEVLELYGDATVSTAASRAGWWVLLASLIIHFISYTHHKRLLERALLQADTETFGPNPGEIWPRLYTLCHLGLFNFVLDFPSWTVPSTQEGRWLCTFVNVLAGLVIVFTVFVTQPFESAWGCYPSKSSVEDLQYGLCPAFFSNEAAFQPVCDQPGVRCGEGIIRDRAVFRHAVAIAQSLLSVSVAVYILSIQEKVSYYRLAAALAKAVASKPKTE